MYEEKIQKLAKLIAFADDEKAPLKPYQLREKAPNKFPYEEYSLVSPEDARKIAPTLNALNDRAKKIEELEGKYKELRVEVEEKIKTLQVSDKYTDVKAEMANIQEKLSTEVEQQLDAVGKALIQHNNTVMTVMETVKEGKATPKEIQEAMIKAIKKYVSEDIAADILKAADKLIAKAEEAKSKTERALVAWPAPQDLEKKVKEQVTTSKIAGILDVLKGIGTKIKETFFGLVDSISDLFVAIDEGQPVIDEMNSLLQQANASDVGAEPKAASKKVANDNSYEYQLLSRLIQDCEFFLGYGNGAVKHLWAGNVEDQIAKMKELYNSFPEDKKPEWITMDKILDYEKQMKAFTPKENVWASKKKADVMQPKTLPELAEKMSDLYGVIFDKNFKVTDAGKFEGEGVATLYYYDAVMNGDTGEFENDFGEGEVENVFKVSPEEATLFSTSEPYFVLRNASNGLIFGDFVTEEDKPMELELGDDMVVDNFAAKKVALKEYTVNDITVSKKQGRIPYRLKKGDAIKTKEGEYNVYTTNDNKYTSTQPDHAEFAYWKHVGEGGTIGNLEYDYIFLTDEVNQQAVDVLNKIVKKYNLANKN